MTIITTVKGAPITAEPTAANEATMITYAISVGRPKTEVAKAKIPPVAAPTKRAGPKTPP